VLPLMADGRVLPYLDVPFQHAHPDVLRRMKRPASGEKNLERLAALARGVPGDRRALHLHRRLPRRDRGRVRAPARLHARGADRPRRLLRLLAVPGAAANELPGLLPQAEREERRARFMAVAEAVSAKLQRRVGATMQVLVDHAPGAGPQGRRGPQLCRRAGDRRHRAPAAAREGQRTLKVGEFTRARIVGADGHDLVAAPA
jgi:ribosomal protein S12 methylthiotransferase